LILFSGSATTGARLGASAASPHVGDRGTNFKTQLDGSIHALFSGIKSAATATPPNRIDADLARSVADQLDRGVSLNDVIARLASSLATSVAAQLGITPQAARQRLTQAFTQALQPSGAGPPGSNAERAAALVARFRQMAELATRVTNGDTGQPIRLIAGTSLDADAAKATPAPDPDRILRDALNALAAPASPSADPTTPAPPGDGRTAAPTASSPAVAAGADTLLGRILARAARADDARPTPVDALLGAGAQPASTRSDVLATAPVTAHAAEGGASSGAVLDAFVQAFAGALARSDATKGHGDASPAPLVTTAAPIQSSPAAQPATPFAISIARDALPAVPPLPAPTLPQPQHVDANAVIDQILRGMAIRTTDGQSEVRLRLVPEQLGDVSVKLIVSAGSVDASITAHTADAQTALAGAQTQLAKSLADAGLKLASFNVGLAGSFADARDHAKPNGSPNRSSTRRIGGVHSTDVEESVDPTLLAVPSFGPPIYSANRSPGAFNYLV
jgi:flagellar hook-length control protein FliK